MPVVSCPLPLFKFWQAEEGKFSLSLKDLIRKKKIQKLLIFFSVNTKNNIFQKKKSSYQTETRLPTKFVLIPLENFIFHSALETYLDNRSDKFFHKIVLQQIRPEVMYKVYKQAFNVGSILILIRHYHQFPIAQGPQFLCCVIRFFEVKS